MGDGYVVTIDLGTSGPKVALFTLDGAYIDGEFEAVDLVLTPDGGVEQRPEDWWQGIVAGAKRMWERVEIDRSKIAAVSVTSQWSGTVPVDTNGSPTHDAIIWMDARGEPQTGNVVRGRVNVEGYDPLKLRKWIQLTGGVPSRSGKDSICHILFIEDQLPEVASRTALYLEPKDYLNLRLTGRAVATYDSIVLHWLTDNRDWDRIDYVPELLAMVGLDRAKLPDLIAATDIVGPLLAEVAAELGVPEGTPVIGGTPDVQSAAIGSGAVEDYAGHLYVGTSSWLTCHIPVKKTNVFDGVAALPSPLPGRYFVADEQETAGACLNWLRDNVLYPSDALATAPPPEDVYQRIDRLAATAPPGSNGVIFTPWLNGERTPVDDHTIRAGWHHLSLGSTRADQVRAVLEGVAFNSRWLLDTVEKFVGRPFDGLNFIGGGANSDLWCQIHADIMNREIRQVEHPIRANARGAALLASLALGETTVGDLSRAVRITAKFSPNPAHRARYDAMYSEFKALYKANKAIHRRLSRS
jgi:xylulokinase